MTDPVTLDRIRVFPVKSLDGVDVDAARLGPNRRTPPSATRNGNRP